MQTYASRCSLRADYACGPRFPDDTVPATPATLLTIFGATGDLAQRMLLPSLYGLHRDGLLHPSLRILGTARSA
ncbi:MAG TPA: hypothetical protein VGE64_03575, partial [Xanthomonadaceae bacterium]